MGANLAWALAGIVALNGSRWVMDRLLVSHVRNDREIVEHRNLAAGALECGATFLRRRCWRARFGSRAGLRGLRSRSFLLGQFALIVLGRLYQRWIGYDVMAEVRSGNFAAGVGFAMTLIALSLLMLKAISGEFTGWGASLSFFCSMPWRG